MTIFNIPSCEKVMVKDELIVCFFPESIKEITRYSVNKDEISNACDNCEYFTSNRETPSFEELVEEYGDQLDIRDYVHRIVEINKEGVEISVLRIDRSDYYRRLCDIWEKYNTFYSCDGGIDVIENHDCLLDYGLKDFYTSESFKLKIPKYLFILDTSSSHYYILLNLEDYVEDKREDCIYLSRFLLGNVYETGIICFGEYDYSLLDIKEAHNMFWETGFNNDLTYYHSHHNSLHIQESYIEDCINNIGCLNNSEIISKLKSNANNIHFFDGDCGEIFVYWDGNTKIVSTLKTYKDEEYFFHPQKKLYLPIIPCPSHFLSKRELAANIYFILEKVGLISKV